MMLRLASSCCYSLGTPYGLTQESKCWGLHVILTMVPCIMIHLFSFSEHLWVSGIVNKHSQKLITVQVSGLAIISHMYLLSWCLSAIHTLHAVIIAIINNTAPQLETISAHCIEARLSRLPQSIGIILVLSSTSNSAVSYCIHLLRIVAPFVPSTPANQRFSRLKHLD